MKRPKVRDVICEAIRIVEGPGDAWVMVVRGRIRATAKRAKPTRKAKK
jgi:hypothetical protein